MVPWGEASHHRGAAPIVEEDLMRDRFSMLALFLGMAIPFAGMAQEGPTQPAQNAAQSWLALIDHGQYSLSWDHAAEFFKASIAKGAWSDAVASVRSPLGALKARTLKSAIVTHNPPGAPAGEYVVIQYDTQFQNKAAAIETITPMHEKDGSWKVCGYFIR
jgi:hypothetical protein